MGGGDVTIKGGNDQTFTLHFDAKANAQLASVLAANISAGVLDHSIIASNDAIVPLNGQRGEYVDTKTPVANLKGTGYDDVVNVNKNATIIGSGGNDERVLSGASNLTFIATGGSGTIVGGAGASSQTGGHHSEDDKADRKHDGMGHGNSIGGGNKILVPAGDNGNWLIETGGGNDTIFALGGGNDTIGAGRGHNLIKVGSGDDVVQSSGNDTIFAGSGTQTVDAAKGSSAVIFVRHSQQLTYVGGSGTSATIIGGSGQKDSQGQDSVVAGSGQDTLFGAGDSSQLSGGSGNDTLMGSQDTPTTGGAGGDRFVFSSSVGGGNDLITNFRSGLDGVLMKGYSAQAVASALDNQQNISGSTTVTLWDNTKLTFENVAHLTNTDIKSG